ncbi:MAG: hypothetical protein M9899_08315 [Bdellovibrionaceae bacterium]|nr:hypothetical protein [Pseudobdellovibrionaceae bacterium]
MKILKRKLLIYAAICLFSSSFSLAKEYRTLTKIAFVPMSLEKENQIEVLSHNLKDNKIKVAMRKSSPHIDNIVNYAVYITPAHEGEKIEMLVNGVQIVAKKDEPVKFFLVGDRKLYPIEFISPIDQEYMGVQIKKGQYISTSLYRSGSPWGTIGEDGYFGRWKEFEEEAKKSPVKDIHGCVGVYESKASQKRLYYIYKGKKIPLDKAEPNFWKANSKYAGNRICSDQPEAIIDCIASGIIDWEYPIIFGVSTLGRSGLNPDEYDQLISDSVKYGKRCDQAVAAYEKKTGKKIRISGYYKSFEQEIKEKQSGK